MLRRTYVTPARARASLAGSLRHSSPAAMPARARPSIHDSARTKTNRPYLIRILIFMPPTDAAATADGRRDDRDPRRSLARSLWRNHR